MKCVEELKKKFKEVKQQNAINLRDLEHLQNNQAKAGEIQEELDRVQYSLDLGKGEVDSMNKKVTVILLHHVILTFFFSQLRLTFVLLPH